MHDKATFFFLLHACIKYLQIFTKDQNFYEKNPKIMFWHGFWRLSIVSFACVLLWFFCNVLQHFFCFVAEMCVDTMFEYVLRCIHQEVLEAVK